jgi:hypothetical protein
MGSGKGSPEGWVAVVKPGRVMFELAGVPEPLARDAMRLAGAQAAGQVQVRDARGLMAIRKRDLRDMPTPNCASTSRPRARAVRPALSERDRRARQHRRARTAKRALARALTVARERELRAQHGGES